jgi:DNA-binding NtrC family response regulator
MSRTSHLAQGGAELVGVNALAASPRVVIVDELDGCGEVLHTLLSSRGVPSIAARGVREGMQLVRRHHPSVVVLDLEAHGADDSQVRDALDQEAAEYRTALIVLGHAPQNLSPLPEAQVLAKPYHYAPLLRTIERLLAR